MVFTWGAVLLHQGLESWWLTEATCTCSPRSMEEGREAWKISWAKTCSTVAPWLPVRLHACVGTQRSAGSVGLVRELLSGQGAAMGTAYLWDARGEEKQATEAGHHSSLKASHGTWLRIPAPDTVPSTFLFCECLSCVLVDPAGGFMQTIRYCIWNNAVQLGAAPPHALKQSPSMPHLLQ